MSGYRTFVFDLDGTLVDSAPAILSCMEAVVREAGHEPVVPVGPGLIGPPLRATLARLTGQADPDAIEALADEFKRRYDDQASALTPAFPEVDALLEGLWRRGANLLLATNKRLLPTERILAARGWDKLFDAVYAQDSIPGGYPGKTKMLEHLLVRQSFALETMIYVGDTREDGVAAKANAMAFAAVSWGYGGDPSGWDLPGPWQRVSRPMDILAW